MTDEVTREHVLCEEDSGARKTLCPPSRNKRNGSATFGLEFAGAADVRVRGPTQENVHPALSIPRRAFGDSESALGQAEP
jgi:hypothetical protein